MIYGMVIIQLYDSIFKLNCPVRTLVSQTIILSAHERRTTCQSLPLPRYGRSTTRQMPPMHKKQNPLTSGPTSLYNMSSKVPNFLLSHQSPPSVDQANRRRRIDFRICSFDQTPSAETRVIAIVEGKGANNAAPSAIEEVEGQAYQASQAYLQAHQEVAFIYSYTLVGTRARIWRCAEMGTFWQCLHGDPSGQPVLTNYIDADSPNASTLRNLFQQAVSQPPGRIAPQVAHVAQATQAAPVAQATQVAQVPPNGWYPVSDGTGRRRYFKDGAWTQHYT
ncbi:hypothetical protein GQ43DRAFT_291739 [Delitschia confertaspora ATCC 74209]|uniref:DUF2510 domain-containing protein n=1 Tax=Delitschia confertaspora ATCC 74209 TaxID=1513339 RepID=A0A9P4MKI2_9PLEO|nr:hypothetical protein GQ43DRAFT_291739 [Delitschia confertaspora ATCC 74209]